MSNELTMREIGHDDLESEQVELLPERREMALLNVKANNVIHVSGHSSLVSTGDVLSGNTL